MHKFIKILFLISALFLSACSGNSNCTEADAYNKMLALQKVQGRLIAKDAPNAGAIVAAMGMETGKISVLIAAKKFAEACDDADSLAKKYGIDLNAEAKDMVTFQELQKDGGKRGGECSLAEAAQRNMAFHKELQDLVDSGKATTEVFRQFSDDTKEFAELMSTDPSAVCRKLDALKSKYKVP